MSSGRLQEVKNNEKLECRHLKKWSRSLTRGSNYRALTGKYLMFWIGGRLREVIAYERLSHMELRLHVYYSSITKNGGR